MCPYVYEHGVSPHLASRLEGNPVRMDVVEKGFWEVCARYDYVTMEGSGGILCPVCFDQEEIWLGDVIRRIHIQLFCPLFYTGQGSKPCPVLTHAHIVLLHNISLMGNICAPGAFLSKVLSITASIREILWRRTMCACVSTGQGLEPWPVGMEIHSLGIRNLIGCLHRLHLLIGIPDHWNHLPFYYVRS